MRRFIVRTRVLVFRWHALVAILGVAACGDVQPVPNGSAAHEKTDNPASSELGGPPAAGADEWEVPVAGDSVLAVAAPSRHRLRILTRVPDESSGWVEQADLDSVAMNGARSRRIALVAREDLVVVGVPRRYSAEGAHEIVPLQPGAVDVYSRSNGRWSLAETLSEPPPVAAETKLAPREFGWAVATNGAVLAIGAPGAPGGGVVYLYSREGGRWASDRVLTNPNAPNDSAFGYSLAFRRNTLFVGAPADPRHGYGNGLVHVFELAGRASTASSVAVLNAPDAPARAAPSCTPSTCRFFPRIVDGFGSSLAVTSDYLAVGAPAAGNQRLFAQNPAYPISPGAGVVYVFKSTPDRGGKFLHTGRLDAPEGMRNFGAALSAAGNRLGVSAPGGEQKEAPASGARLARIEVYTRISGERWKRGAPAEVAVAAAGAPAFTTTARELVVAETTQRNSDRSLLQFREW